MFELVLMVIAYIVFLLVALKKNAWGWIVLYWAVLFLKNADAMRGVI